MVDGVQVDGLKELEKVLLSLQTEVAGKALRGALMKAAEPTKLAAIAMVPVDSGMTRDNIKKTSQLGKSRQDSSAVVHVGVSTKKAPQALQVEYGTSNQAAHPFLRPALEQTWNQSVLIFKKSLQNRIKRAVKAGKLK
jgi:HK97 gp10 family phage protein